MTDSLQFMTVLFSFYYHNVEVVYSILTQSTVFPDGSVVKNLPANTGNTSDVGLIPGSGRSPGAENGNLL